MFLSLSAMGLAHRYSSISSRAYMSTNHLSNSSQTFIMQFRIRNASTQMNKKITELAIMFAFYHMPVEIRSLYNKF